MRRFAMGAGLALLAGCTIEPGTAVPQSVLVQGDRLTVRMNDGWPCTGFRDETTETARVVGHVARVPVVLSL
jgi:hypothetical protein